MTIATFVPNDQAAVKSRQRATWSSAVYAMIGTTRSITGELLCEAVKLRLGQRVLEFHRLPKKSV